MSDTTQTEEKQEMKTTPGPWKANGHMVDYLTPEGNLVTVASVNACWHKIGDQEANARLIAAAPELLEALAFYVSVCGNTAYSIGRQTAQEMYEKGFNAIAKALGTE